jgi:hypothetical protein
MRPFEVHALILKFPDGEGYALLLFDGEIVPPCSELIRKFNFICHEVTMSCTEYVVKYIFQLGGRTRVGLMDIPVQFPPMVHAGSFHAPGV